MMGFEGDSCEFWIIGSAPAMEDRAKKMDSTAQRSRQAGLFDCYLSKGPARHRMDAPTRADLNNKGEQSLFGLLPSRPATQAIRKS